MSDWTWHPERAEGDRWVESDPPPDPETEMLMTASPAAILTAGGIQRAPEVVELAAATGLDLAAAAVMLEKESGGGANIFGHDNVPTGGAYVKGEPVTQAKYAAYRAAVIGGRAGRQGVGPCQLTWGGYQDQADGLGGCWDWRCNVQVGFQALAAHIRDLGLFGGMGAYNGSGPAAQAYANDAMAKYQVWATRLGVQPANGGVSVASIWDRREGPWGGGITDIPDPVNGEQYDLFEFVKRNNVTTYQTALIVSQLLKLAQAKPPGILRSDVNAIAATVAQHPALAALVAPANDPLLTASFWAQTGERAVKSIAGSLISIWGASGALNLFSIPWQSTVGVALGAGVLSVLMSIMSAPVGPLGSPSLVGKPQ